jgi:polysaccharide deacetylase family protein (PEP-CTERM system associated)
MLKTVQRRRRPAADARPTSVCPLAGSDPRPLNALTVDVEDYYHVSAFEEIAPRERWNSFPSRIVSSTGRILDVLGRSSVKATFFVLGWVADRHPALVRAIRSAGHEVACHSYWHRLVYRQTPKEFRADLRRARDVLQDLTGEAVTAYRAPSFSITRKSLWALDVLIEEGFAFDSSVYPTYHDRYGIPGAPAHPHTIRRPAGVIHEFPMAVWHKFGYPLPVGGGGYFRLYPYFVTRWGLRSLNARGAPFAAYVHPWELDPDQPRLSPGRVRAFRHYIGLRRTEAKLARLLRDFRLGTLSEAFAALGMRGELQTWELPAAE